GSELSLALSAMKVLSSPSLILMRPRSLPSLPSLTLPLPLTGSYSQAPSQVNDAPALVGRTLSVASKQCIRSRSPRPVIELIAGPRSSRPSLTHCEVSMIRHQPLI